MSSSPLSSSEPLDSADKRVTLTDEQRKARNKKNNIRRKASLKARGIKSKYHNSTYRIKKKILGNRSHGWCKICRLLHPREILTIDHIIPISEGGSFKKENLQLICRPCHDLKSKPL